MEVPLARVTVNGYPLDTLYHSFIVRYLRIGVLLISQITAGLVTAVPATAASATVSANDAAAAARQYRSQAEVKYQEAVSSFDKAILADADEFRWTRQSRLFETKILEETGQYDTAIKEYGRLIDGFPDTPESLAAEFYRAELHEKFGRHTESQDGYRRVITVLNRTPTYTNPWLTKEDIIRRVQQVFTDRIELGEYQAAFDILKVLTTVLPKGTIARLSSVGLSRWAESLRSKAEASSYDLQEAILRDAREKYTLAGDWFVEVARYDFGTSLYVDDIWNSAENYRMGRQYPKAIPQYKKYLDLETRARQQQSLIYLGEMYFEMDLLPQAAESLEEQLRRFPGSVMSYYASLVLSYVYMEQKEWDKAELLLQQNLAGVMSPSAAEYRDSLFALGRLYYRHRQYDEAIVKLEDATTLFPDAIQTPESHYLIAMSYLRTQVKLPSDSSSTSGTVTSASSPTSSSTSSSSVLPYVQAQVSQQNKESRAAALLHLNEAQKQLIARQNTVNLTEAEQRMLRNCFFGIGTVLLDLGPEYEDEAVRALNIAATRYQNLPESLEAMIQIARIFRSQGRKTEAVGVIDLAKILLKRLEANGAFGTNARFRSKDWEDLLNWSRNL